jgi:methylmalonyl-CoA/ethylmalonyl-CoA epimerase
MGAIRRLDHVAIAVRDTSAALQYFRDRLQLRVVSSEELATSKVRLTHLDCGNALLQLVEPLTSDTEVASFIRERGEGIHHICFGVDDPSRTVRTLVDDGSTSLGLGSGRGRVTLFIPGVLPHGVRLELIEFRLDEDVRNNTGWLTDSNGVGS